MEKQIKAVIFDLDGTLIDTEKYYVQLGLEITKEMGYDVPKEVVLSMQSLNRQYAKPMMQKRYGEDFDFDYFHAARRERIAKLLKQNGIEKKPHADEILSYLRKHHYQIAVATATDIEIAQRYLKEVQLDNQFDRIISASHVKNGKPKPDVYLYACEQLGEKPENCLAVEDSKNGVLSAYTAGMQVVMVPDLTMPDMQTKSMLYGQAKTLWNVKDYL